MLYKDRLNPTADVCWVYYAENRKRDISSLFYLDKFDLIDKLIEDIEKQSRKGGS